MSDVNIIQKMLSLAMLGTEWILWLLIILSIISLAIIIERMVYFSKVGINVQDFTLKLSEFLVAEKPESILGLCEKYSFAIESQTIKIGLEQKKMGVKAMEERMQALLVGKKQELDRGLVVLGTLGNNAPFIGLFGTVIGIIQAFHELSLNPAGGPSVVMSGISEALVATAVGLMVAIPAVIAFNAFQRVVKRHLANSEAAMKIMLSHYQEK